MKFKHFFLTASALYLFSVDKKRDSNSLQGIKTDTTGKKMAGMKPLVTQLCLKERGHAAEETDTSVCLSCRYVPKQNKSVYTAEAAMESQRGRICTTKRGAHRPNDTQIITLQP